MKLVKLGLAFLAVILVFAATRNVINTQPVAVTIPSYDHIFFVIDENHSRTQVIGPAPYLTALASANAQSTQQFAVTHPSVNNYLALFSGQTYGGITDSCTVGSGTCHTTAPNIADEIIASGRTAKGYMESMPSACYVSHDSGAYTERHNPFPYFDQIRTNAARCNAEDVPYTQLASDLSSAATTPNFVWVTPNLNNDMHNGTVAQGDTWAKANFPAIFNSPAWRTQHSLFVFTTDEDSGGSGNNVPFFAISSDGTTKTNFTSTVHGTHYSWLRTIEASWGLGQMAAGDAGASPLTDLFVSGGSPPSPTPTSTPTPTPLPTPTPTPSTTPTPTPSTTPTPTPSPSQSPSPTPTPSASTRAAFYYGWFPEAWNQGLNPFTRYNPWLGFYDSSDFAVIRSHIAAMQYGGIKVGIASWWGQGTPTDGRVPALLNAAHGTGFQWSLYYEPALSASQVASDLTYINAHYGSDPSLLHVNGKPVIFVYSRSVASCANAATWVNNNQGDYLSLQVFGGYTGCAPQPDSWHQYSPAARTDSQGRFSFSISPGFWKANEAAPRLVRDSAAFATACRQMVSSNAQWQLITTWNEWGEGSQIENAMQYISPSGYGAFVDALHACS